MSAPVRPPASAPRLFFLLTVAWAAPACTDSAPPPESSPSETAEAPTARVYVERLGQDTLAVERFELDDTSLVGTLVLRSPVTRVIRYRGTVGPDGGVRTLEGTATTPPANPEGPAPRSFSARLEGDSARVVVTSEGDTTRRVVAAPPGTLLTPPQLPAAPSAFEVAGRRFLALERDTLEVGFLNPLAAASGVLLSRVYRRDAETLAATIFGGLPMLLRLDDAEHLEWLDGRETTFKVRTTPASELDVAATADAFARRDAAGQGFGAPSPPGSVRETVAGATIEVHYSRPAVRGREIWGGLVPWDSVWRTGANAATTFSSDRDLVFGEGVGVPAGEYTLWSTFTPSRGTLIINSQTGQWGTAYDESRDFVRVPLEMETLRSPVERFTIAVESTGEGGRLALAWADRVYSVPFQVR